ncbi:preprotein translocase subunit YajC [Streptomyces sp. URMC 123]|uniref:preprotein translocase subunit YajC n=1 Tax=Streptomyces sp. URMC 123 TaxID=3423403 RepID=UPI003F1BFD6F
MNIVTLLPFIVLIGAMFLMTRSAKNKQRQAAQMRDQMQPGTGVRTIGGMYATVKEVHHDTVLLEVAPGVHAVFAKNSVGAVLEDEEYQRIVHGGGDDAEVAVPDDASSLTATDETPAAPIAPADPAATDSPRIDLGKPEASADEKADAKGAAGTEAKKAKDAPADAAEDGKKTDGDTGTK